MSLNEMMSFVPSSLVSLTENNHRISYEELQSNQFNKHSSDHFVKSESLDIEQTRMANQQSACSTSAQIYQQQRKRAQFSASPGSLISSQHYHQQQQQQHNQQQQHQQKEKRRHR